MTAVSPSTSRQERRLRQGLHRGDSSGMPANSSSNPHAARGYGCKSENLMGDSWFFRIRSGTSSHSFCPSETDRAASRHRFFTVRVAGISDTIRARSVVGRFLEHSRLDYFANGGQPEVPIGSADLMERNLDRRVETLCHVRDPDLRNHLYDVVLQTLLADTDRTMELPNEGSCRPVHRKARARPVTRRRAAASVQMSIEVRSGALGGELIRGTRSRDIPVVIPPRSGGTGRSRRRSRMPRPPPGPRGRAFPDRWSTTGWRSPVSGRRPRRTGRRTRGRRPK